jgi:hypothetical protein
MASQHRAAVGFGPAGLTALVLLMLAAGCGGPAPGRVTGRVLLDGKPVLGGVLTFVPADFKGPGASATVDESGGYTVELPPGDVLVSFDNHSLAPPPPRQLPPLPKGMSPEIAAKLGGRSPGQPAPPADPPARSGRYVKVPDRYFTAETANLKFTVTPGDQQHDIELTSKP